MFLFFEDFCPEATTVNRTFDCVLLGLAPLIRGGRRLGDSSVKGTVHGINAFAEPVQSLDIPETDQLSPVLLVRFASTLNGYRFGL